MTQMPMGAIPKKKKEKPKGNGTNRSPRKLFYEMKRNYSAYLFLLPKLILFTLFVAIPVVWAFVLSFQKYKIFGSEFVGFENYIKVFESEAFRIALKNTMLFTVVTVPFGVISALVLSTLIFELGKVSQSLFRSAFYLPTVTSMVIIAMVWRWMYNYDFGLFNYVLGWFGVGPVNWLGQSSTALWALIIMQCLIPFGVGIIMYLASMGSISQSLYEAARMDGAGKFKQWIHITIPLLKPTTLYLVLLSTIGSFQVFTQIIMMTGEGLEARQRRSSTSFTKRASGISNSAWQELNQSYYLSLSSSFLSSNSGCFAMMSDWGIGNEEKTARST